MSEACHRVIPACVARRVLRWMLLVASAEQAQALFCCAMQILNLTQALKDGKSPLHLVQMPPVIVETARSHQRAASESYTQSFQSRKPFFTWW